MATTFFKWYMLRLNTHPIATKSITSALIMGGGDVIQQSIEQWDSIKYKFNWQPKHLKADTDTLSEVELGLRHSSGTKSTTTTVNGASDVKAVRYEMSRCLRMAAFGLVIVGPLCHQWYLALESFVPRADFVGAITKMVVDQAVMAPFSTVLFFTSMTLMEGKTLTDAQQVVTDKTWPTLLVNWKIWPVCQVINMYFVPVSLRVLFLNVIGLGYNTILSRIANNK